MNIFILDTNPRIAAKYHCDQHVIKMILESAQMLSTAHRVINGKKYIDQTSNGRKIQRWKLSENESVIYKATHVNHPCNIWARESVTNYNWLYELFWWLNEEYTYRFGKQHLSYTKLADILIDSPGIKQKDFTPFPCVVPSGCILHWCVVDSYRLYYQQKTFAKWTKRNVPGWYKKPLDFS